MVYLRCGVLGSNDDPVDSRTIGMRVSEGRYYHAVIQQVLFCRTV